ncbi:hypothetical protein GTO89_01565 [Heliobacterium gestii]|uniref:Uncharacterized protein n=1 Tax=Heliomicrobium gestii TaxID=2699 RepID=A0A845L685_HELGE|nr:hypothetical protein [Heliomicrobium gestii]MBM7865464.1 hypothetical protein [Heliomicrobium gestii]MZP41718.1 hypothetical protein [Heliomicrobium gestii]
MQKTPRSLGRALLRTAGHLWLMVFLIAPSFLFVSPAQAFEALFPAHRFTSIRPDGPVLALDQSIRIYGRLFHAGQTDYFTVHGQSGEELRLELAVPRLDGLEQFRPSIAVIGPGLPMGDRDGTYFTVPNGLGAHVIEPAARERELVDAMSGAPFRLTQAFQFRLPAAADYYIAVFDKSGERGKYVLHLGPAEETSVVTALRHPIRFFEIRAWYHPTQLLAVFALAVMASAVFFAAWLGRRRKRK